MIGREQELEAAGSVVAAVADGPCALVLLGEAGIGKSTIWSAVVAEAGNLGHRILMARPSESEAELPFAVLVDLFADVDDVVVDALPDVQRVALEKALRRSASAVAVDPTAVALATLGALRALAEARPAIVAIDDLQWVDAPSRRALAFAFRRLRDAGVGLIATARTGSDPALTTLGTAGASDETRIEVTGLDERHLAELVRVQAGVVLTPLQLQRVTELSGGNPFYALQLATADDVEEGLPHSLTAALRSRLSALSAEARGAGLVAATLGRVDEPLLRRLRGTGLDELWAAGIVDDRGGTTWFAHPLLASALIDLHAPAERHAVHLSLAAALDDPDERALHLGRGTVSTSEAVAAELEQAAKRIDLRGAPETAARLAERAAMLTPSTHLDAWTRRMLTAADLYQAAGEGRGHVQPILDELVASLGPGTDRARVLVRLGWLGAQTDALPASEAIAVEHRALAESGGAADVDMAAHAVLARLLGNAGDYRDAHRHATLAVELCAGSAPDLMFPSPHGELGSAVLMVGAGLDEDLLCRGIEQDRASGTVPEPFQTCEFKLALGLLYTGQLVHARALLDDLHRRSEELGRIRSMAGCALYLVDLEVRAGDLDAAESWAAEFVHLDRQLRGGGSTEWYPSALVAVHRGRVEDARRILAGGIAYSRSIESTIWLSHQLGALGHLELALGNVQEAAAVLGEIVSVLRETGLGEWSVHPVHPDVIEAFVGCGALDEAERLADELRGLR